MTTQPVTKSSIRRRLAVAGLAGALGLGSLGATFGFSSSPGRVRTADRSAEIAIPGVRGTGGGTSGGGLYGFTTSPGRRAGALYGISTSPGRKAGGKGSLEY